MFYPKSPFIKHTGVVNNLRNEKDVTKAIDIDRLLEWLCTTPRTTSIRVNLLRTTTDNLKLLLLDEFMKNYPSIDCPKMTVPEEFPEIILIGHLSNSEDLVPNAEQNDVIVDVNCAASILRGAHLYAPGVLAMETNTNLNEYVNVFADLDGTCKRGTTTFDSPNRLFIGHGVVKMQRHQLFRNNINASGIAVEMKNTLSNVPSIGDAYLPVGCAMLQNLPSIICARVLGPIVGDKILDMCAAPGNKTSHLAEIIKDDGLIVAIDKTPNKLKLLEEKIKSYQLKSVKCFAFDSTKLLLKIGDAANVDVVASKDNSQLSPPFRGQFFDKILLDAPCSSLGNRPQLRNDISVKMLASYPIIQKKLFATAVELLKSEGILVYSTCTITSAENEEIVEWALNKFENIELVAAAPLIAGPGWPNVGLIDEQRLLVQRFGPERDCLRLSQAICSDTVGFFIAKFRKK